MHPNSRQSGNVALVLFAAVAMVGAIGVSATSVMKGPVRGMQEVTKRAIADDSIQAAASLLMINANGQSDAGDCDGDDKVEPIEWSDLGVGPKPNGGGYLPSILGAAPLDPWGNTYGYCVWDHGVEIQKSIGIPACTLPSQRLQGTAGTDEAIIIAVMSPGADRRYDTTCGDDPVYVTKVSGSDDIVLTLTYEEAMNSGADLWNLKAGTPTTAEISARDIEIVGSSGSDTAKIGYDSTLGISGVGEFMANKADNFYSKTPNGTIQMESPLRIQAIEDLDPPTNPAASDNLGNHLATQDVDLSVFDILNGGDIRTTNLYTDTITAKTSGENGTVEMQSPLRLQNEAGHAVPIKLETDTLLNLGCATGEIPKWSGAEWTCSPDGVTAAGSAGYIQFNNGSNVLAADSALYWNNTNKNLGIGSSSPAAKIDVAGGVKIGSDSDVCPGTDNVKLGTLRMENDNVEICKTGGWSSTGASTSSGGSGPMTYIPNSTPGHIYCWGRNQSGQLGDGTTVDKSVPTMAGVGRDWIELSSERSSACGIKADHTLWCWGASRTGDGTTNQRNSPVQIGTLKTWAQVSVGADHKCALRTDGTLWCWGNNGNGQVGDGSTTARSSPVQVGTDKWKQIEADYYWTCGIRDNGTLWCWGWYLMAGGSLFGGADKISPFQLGTHTDWRMITMRNGGVCGMRGTSGTLWCANGGGGVSQQASSITDWIAYSRSTFHQCGIRSDGTLWCWGSNGNGQLGDGTTSDSGSPKKIGTDIDWIEVATQHPNTCARKSNGTLWCWGKNVYGQVGDGTTIDVLVPTQITSSTRWLQIGIAGDSAEVTCARMDPAAGYDP